MNRFALGLFAASLAFAVPALATDDTGAWYVSPMAQWTFVDHDRDAYDDAGFQFGIGHNFSANISAELNASQTRFDGSNRSRLSLSYYSADVLYKFLPDSLVRPYLLAGAGGIDDKQTGFARTSTFAGEVGGGLLWAFGDQTGSKRFLLRTEAKYRKTIGDMNEGFRNPGDAIVGVGLLFEFGIPQPAPVIAPKPLDSDGDGVTDDKDQCPGTPLGARVDEKGCEFDSDGDGVVDRLDQCPDTPKGTPVNEVGCPLDSDGDGVVDRDDRCPNTPKGDRVDIHGCTIKGEIQLPGVNFNVDSAVLLPESTAILDDAASTLKKYPQFVIEVQGHTDNTASVKHNLVLSQHRAESVQRYLKDHGVPNTLTAKGYGKALPIADNKTPEGRLLNRRVTLKIKSGE